MILIIYICVYSLGVAPFPVTVSTRIITFSVGDPYKPSCTVTGRGPHPIYIIYIYIYWVSWIQSIQKSIEILHHFIFAAVLGIGYFITWRIIPVS